MTQPGGSGGLRNWMGGGRKDKRKQPTSTRHAGPPPAGVDRRGYGIKVLATCAEPVVDICFVHGLSGTRVGTWRAKGCEHPWPQDLLPRSLGNVRVLTYGYDASTRPKDKSAGRGSSNRLLENAQNLALDLQNMRDEDPGAAGRPIIFVAHSLGGLVCKEALVYARDNVYSGTRGVYDCTHGVIFLGTPHRGASAAKDMAPFARALSAHTSASLEANLDLLKPGNQHLDGLLRDFSNLVLNRASQGKPIHVVCFFEEHETRIGAFKPRHIVPRESAVVDGWAHYGIPADHAHMVKFASHEDPGYKRVCFFLNRWTRDIATRLESRKHSQHPPGLTSLRPAQRGVSRRG